MKALKLLLVGICLFACFGIARAGPNISDPNAYFAKALQQNPADGGSGDVPATKFAANFKVTTAGNFSQILSYTPIDIKDLFGKKGLSFQIWTYGGTSLASAALNGGGSGVFRIKFAANLYINAGIDILAEEGKRPVVSGVLGVEVLRF